jgi:hypothetical protein
VVVTLRGRKANPNDNSIIASPSAGATGLAAGRTKAPSQPLKESESAPRALKGAPGQNAALGPGAPKPGSSSASPGDTLRRKGKEYRSLQAGKSVYRSDKDGITDLSDSLHGFRQPAAMTPEQRRVVIEKLKLSQALMAKLAAFRKVKGAKPEVMEVQVWLNAWPSDGLTKLRSAGFTFAAALTPHRLLLGAISMDKLDALLSLPFVGRVETPKFRW